MLRILFEILFIQISHIWLKYHVKNSSIYSYLVFQKPRYLSKQNRQDFKRLLKIKLKNKVKIFYDFKLRKKFLSETRLFQSILGLIYQLKN